MKSIKWIAGGLLAVLVVCGVLLFVNSIGEMNFYYPNRDYEEISFEKREVEYDSDEESFEMALVKKYMLGPLSYDLRLNIDPETYLLNVWVIEETPGNTPSIVLNFGGNFMDDLIDNNETYQWMIEGLMMTLKENTKIQELMILDNGTNVNIKVGDWNIAYPIQVK